MGEERAENAWDRVRQRITAPWWGEQQTSRDLLVATLQALTTAERREVATRLTAWVRAGGVTNPSQAAAVILSALATIPGAAATAALVTRRDLGSVSQPLSGRAITSVLADRDPAWLADLGGRVAVRGQHRIAVSALRLAGAPMPVTAESVTAWLPWLHQEQIATRDDDREPPTIPALQPMLAGAFEHDAVAGAIDDRVAETIVELTRRGALDRAWVLHQALDRLVRGGRPKDLTGLVRIVQGLAPTPTEFAAHATALLALARSAPAPVAKVAWAGLLDAADDGALDPEILCHGAEEMLRRPEKGPARSAVQRLEGLAVARPDLGSAVVTALLVGAGHPALDVAERAALALTGLDLDAAASTLVAEALPTLPAAVAERLRPLAPSATWAAPSEPAAPTDVPAERPPAEAWPADPGPEQTLAHVLDWLGTYGAAYRPSVEACDLLPYERALAGIVALGWRSPETLAEALRGARVDLGGSLARAVHGLRSALTGRPLGREAERAWERLARYDDGRLPSNDLEVARLVEIAVHLPDRPVPVLLATPTRLDGTLEAAVLVERLRTHSEAAAISWPLDLEQALLRLTLDDGADLGALADQALQLETTAGTITADWLRRGGLPEPIVTLEVHQAAQQLAPSLVADIAPGTAPAPLGAGPITRRLLDRTHAPTGAVSAWTPSWLETRPLPHHRDVVATWVQTSFAARPEGTSPHVGLVAAAHGPFGPGCGALAATMLTSRDRATRTQAVDLLLEIDRPWGAATAAAIVRGSAAGAMVASRVVEPLTDLAVAGAAYEVVELLLRLLPPLVGSSTRGTPDVLALTTRLISEHGLAGHDVEAVDSLSAAVAGITGSTRLAQECARLAARLDQSPRVGARI